MDITRKNRVLTLLSISTMILFLLAVVFDAQEAKSNWNPIHPAGWLQAEASEDAWWFGSVVPYSTVGQFYQPRLRIEKDVWDTSSWSTVKSPSGTTSSTWTTIVPKTSSDVRVVSQTSLPSVRIMEELAQVDTHTHGEEEIGTDTSKKSLDELVQFVQFEYASNLSTSEKNAWKSFYADLFQKFPATFYESIKYFRLRNQEESSRGLSGSNIMIMRLNDMDKKEASAVFTHELGHLVDLGHLTGHSSQKSTFMDGSKNVLADDPSVQFYQISWYTDERMKSTTKEDFVTTYAMSNPFEDFAETFIYYVIHGDHFRMLAQKNTALKAKYEFMKETVFEGKEYFGLTQMNTSRYTTFRPYDATVQNYDYVGFTQRDFQ